MMESVLPSCEGGEKTMTKPGSETPVSGAQADAVRARVRRLFRKSETDEVTRAFFELVLQHRLEKLR